MRQLKILFVTSLLLAIAVITMAPASCPGCGAPGVEKQSELTENWVELFETRISELGGTWTWDGSTVGIMPNTCPGCGPLMSEPDFRGITRGGSRTR